METRAAARSWVAGASLAARTPAHLFFMVSAVFHYLGPAFAVLLFAQIAPLGVAWLRIASAAAVFALWRSPWRDWGPPGAPVGSEEGRVGEEGRFRGGPDH